MLSFQLTTAFETRGGKKKKKVRSSSLTLVLLTASSVTRPAGEAAGVHLPRSAQQTQIRDCCERFGDLRSTPTCPFLQLPTSDKGRRSADIKLQDASKQFSRKLSCGASITKNAVGKKQIDVQGDFVHEVRLSKCGRVGASNENVERRCWTSSKSTFLRCVSTSVVHK